MIDHLQKLLDFINENSSLAKFNKTRKFLFASIIELDAGRSLSSSDLRRLDNISIESLTDMAEVYNTVLLMTESAKSFCIKYELYNLEKDVIEYYEFNNRKSKIRSKIQKIKSLIKDESFVNLSPIQEKYIKTVRGRYEDPERSQYVDMLTKNTVKIYLEERKITNVDSKFIFQDNVDEYLESARRDFEWHIKNIRQDFESFCFYNNKIGELALVEIDYLKGNYVPCLILSDPKFSFRLSDCLVLDVLLDGEIRTLPIFRIKFEE